MGAPRPQAIPSGRSQRRLPPVLALLLSAALAMWALGTAASLYGESPDAAVYREAVVGDSAALDPHGFEPTPRDPDLTPLLFRGLVSIDEHGSVNPDLAERWEVEGRDRVYRLFLREGLTWDDGQPLTAEDVVYSARRLAEAARLSRQVSVWSAVEVRALGARVVECALREPLGTFLEHAALPVVAAHAPPAATSPLGAGAPAPASSGPYRLAQSRPGVVALERNPTYGGTPASLGRVEFRLFPTREAALAALRAGEVDGMAGLLREERSQLESSDGIAVYQVPEYSKQSLLVLNVRGGVLQEPGVRHAVSLAIDRRELVRRVLVDAGEPGAGPLSPLSWASEPNLPHQRFDPVAAEALLEQAGWRAQGARPRRRGESDLTIRLLTSDAEPRQREANEVARQLGSAGFEVLVEGAPLEVLRDRLETGRFDAALLGRWLAETDPDQFALWHSSQIGGLGGNFSGITSPRLDRWLEVGRREHETAIRLEAYRRFQESWDDEQPAVLLYHPRTAYAVSRDIRGVRGGPLPDVSWRLKELPGWYRDGRSGRISWPNLPGR